MPGPPPKREAERRRRNEPRIPVTKVDVADWAAEALGDAPVEDVQDSLPFKVAQPIVVPVYDGSWDVETDSEGQPTAEAKNRWHPLAQDLWDTYSKSGQALYWQPSDWAMAAFVCETISRELLPQIIGYKEYGEGESHVKEPIWGPAPVKGATISAVMKAAGALMMLEGDRRRLGLELTSRYAAAEAPAAPTGEQVSANRLKLIGGSGA